MYIEIVLYIYKNTLFLNVNLKCLNVFTSLNFHTKALTLLIFMLCLKVGIKHQPPLFVFFFDDSFIFVLAVAAAVLDDLRLSVIFAGFTNFCEIVSSDV